MGRAKTQKSKTKKITLGVRLLQNSKADPQNRLGLRSRR